MNHVFNFFNLKPIVLLSAGLLLSLGTSLAEINPGNYFQLTREANIASALALLTQVEGEETIQSLQAHQAHLVFQDLSSFGRQYAGDDAMTLVNYTTHQQVIYISNRHQNAPPQALAALIRHEAMHSDNANSIQEETCAWTTEAQTWQAMQKAFPQLSSIPIKTSPLVDRLNAIVILLNANKLAAHIHQNPGYRDLAHTSPGFDNDTVMLLLNTQKESLEKTSPRVNRY